MRWAAKLGIPLTAGAMAVAVVMVGDFEGKRNVAYRDTGGVPTICYGYTHGVKMGQVLDDRTCDRLLSRELGHAFDTLDALTDTPLHPATRAALASFIYNVGSGQFSTSTLLKRLNAGRIRAACDELRRWVYDDGEKLRGLVKRREIERKVCLYGLERQHAGEQTITAESGR